jgi:RNA polymerase sigma-70 factor (ECF subfamily)
MQDQEAAFTAYRDRYRGLVVATARKFLHQDAEVEDIEQNVFLKVWQHWDQIQLGKLNGGWLVTLTRNECFDYLKDYRSKVHFFSELEDKHETGCFPDRMPIPGQTARPELHERLREALQELPEHQALTLYLHYFEEWSLEDIAQYLGRDMQVVKNNMSRGRAALAKLLSVARYGVSDKNPG